MILGGSKKEVIKNISKNCESLELNKKVEIGDPVLSDKEIEKKIKNFYKIRENKEKFLKKSEKAYKFLEKISKELNDSIEIEGLENIKDITSGAIVTSNHFNPMDNMIVRKMIKERFDKDLYVVSQETNLAMPGFLGYLMNYLKIIPICKSPHYINEIFKPYLKEIIDDNNFVLIYPEEEMWFNYRKPRPCKRGSYLFAAELNVPVISCFVEMIDLDTFDNAEFKNVKYIIHILKTIYPDKEKSIRQNSIDMAEIDYKQKKEAYENAYGKKLDYTFDYSDIAGYKH
jgi:1-acyl-sn-glycerol-3-phosphate acyltransferase